MSNKVCDLCKLDWKNGACGSCSLTREQLDAIDKLEQEVKNLKACADTRDNSLKNPMVYRVLGWSRRTDISMGSCIFSIELDARFAEKARALEFPHQQKFAELARDIVGYKYTRTTFLGNTAFLRSMAVEGDCACLGVSGSLLEADWSSLDVIRFDGHNIDSKAQAYDLLAVFSYWVETVEAFLD